MERPDGAGLRPGPRRRPARCRPPAGGGLIAAVIAGTRPPGHSGPGIDGGARRVFVTGANGYLGSRLVPALLARGHRVARLVRPGRERLARRLPPGDGKRPGPGKLSGMPSAAPIPWSTSSGGHPGPAKAAAFRSVDLASLQAALAAARGIG